MKQIKITQSVTARTMTVDGYLRDIGRYPMASPEEETELAARIAAGDDGAFRRLVEANLRFVVSVAKQYQNRGLELSDLINEGNLGLMKAAARFDSTRGFKFISYAVWWIRQQIMQALSDQGRMVRLPLKKVGLLNRVAKKRIEFEQENEREPTPEELVVPDESAPQADFGLQTESLQSDLADVLGILSPREREILVLAFGIGCQEMTLEEIGERFVLTRERVRQVKEKAIRKLSRDSVHERLAQYL